MENIKRYKSIGPHNKSVLYLTCYDSMVVASIFIGAHHKSFIVPDGNTDISLGEIRGEQFHFNLNQGENEVYGHYPDGKVRTLDPAMQNLVLKILLHTDAI